MAIALILTCERLTISDYSEDYFPRVKTTSHESKQSHGK